MIQNDILVLVCLTAVHLSPTCVWCSNSQQGGAVPNHTPLPELTKFFFLFNASSAATLLMAFLNVNPNPSRCQHYVTSDISIYTEWRFMKNEKYVYLHLYNAATFTAPRSSFQELRRLWCRFRCVTNIPFIYNEKLKWFFFNVKYIFQSWWFLSWSMFKGLFFWWGSFPQCY